MAAQKLDLNELIRKIPVAKAVTWAKANAEKFMFWVLVAGLIYTCFLVFQSYQKPLRVLPESVGTASDAPESQVPLKSAATRGFKYASDYAIVAERNPFVACEKIEVPVPAQPALQYVQFVSEQMARFKDEKQAILEISVGGAVGPWTLQTVTADKVSFKTRYEHVWDLALNKKEEVKPAPPAPTGYRFQGKQKDSKGNDAAWIAPDKTPSMERLVSVGFNFGAWESEKDKDGWMLQEVAEDRVVLHYAPVHPIPPKDVTWPYVDPPISIVYTGQSQVGVQKWAHFKVQVQDRRGKTQEKGRSAAEGEGIKDTTYKLETIAPDHVIVSRGERTYRLQLKVEQVEKQAEAKPKP